MRKIIFLALSLAFILFSCDNGNVDNETSELNQVIGTWENATEIGIETFVFSENTVTSIYKSLLPAIDPFTVNGTYQCYDTVLIFRMESGTNFFADFSISENKLTMLFSHSGNTVVYTKKN